MAHTVISMKLPPNIDPTKARLAYGGRALPKLVSVIITSFVGHAVGRDAFVDNKMIVPLSELFDDNVYQARRNAHKAIEMCVHMSPGTEGVVDAKLVPVLVGKLLKEEDEIKVWKNTKPFQHIAWIAKAARDVMDLSFPLDGKDKAVDVGAIPELVSLLEDANSDVRAQAAGAIMTITITTKGKYAAIDEKAIPNLVKLLDDPESEVRLNAL
ncbi:radial spoke head 14 homolog [Stylophora pistillata]|uniref:radial spoke head 14 homolog n=1 Tax=Stylophora pistillata TaxID=50429 RepID=UPI000C04CE26|nr:radial spoke head 14 homolog [Stylophora pistillata]